MENKEETILLIPDVHGREFWREGLEKRNPGELMIFLGDYTDPYPDEGITHEVVPGMIREILEIPDTVLLLGNHDLSYIYPEFTSCRHDRNRERCKEVHDLFVKNRDRFSLTHVIERSKKKYIFSHAGLLAEMYKRDSSTKPIMVAEELNKRWKEDDLDLSHELDMFSWYRGGWSNCGSVVWADVREHVARENSFWDKVYQVFGHTMLIQGKILKRGLFADVDCQRPVRLWVNQFQFSVL